jgi:hypothetical protein
MPSLVVHAVARVEPVVEQLGALAQDHRLALGGAVAADSALEGDGVRLLGGDVIAEAALIAEGGRRHAGAAKSC